MGITGTRDPGHRIETLCDSCQQIDDHPRHHTYDPQTHRLESHHLDCGASGGCTVCLASELLTAGKRGEQLVKHVATEKHGDALAAALGASTPNVGVPNADQAG